MSACKPIGDGKPKVWKDDDGWRCDQTVRCLTCNDIWFDDLAEYATWAEAMAASIDARPTQDDA